MMVRNGKQHFRFGLTWKNKNVQNFDELKKRCIYPSKWAKMTGDLNK